jgi:hypothetical protein
MGFQLLVSTSIKDWIEHLIELVLSICLAIVSNPQIIQRQKEGRLGNGELRGSSHSLFCGNGRRKTKTSVRTWRIGSASSVFLLFWRTWSFITNPCILSWFIYVTVSDRLGNVQLLCFWTLFIVLFLIKTQRFGDWILSPSSRPYLRR